MTLRLFFNRHGELPWSIDSGIGTTEQYFRHVSIEVPCIAVYKPENKTPTGWLEVADATIQLVSADVVRIVATKEDMNYGK